MRHTRFVSDVTTSASVLAILAGVLIILFPNIIEYTIAGILILGGITGLLASKRGYHWR
ncbi:DUF3096 domain-containing protein [Candidatus Woesearchaeota archaeon]|nr:MAG: DUF3096 domain-containing protein [Candidatus Woesearchaeota archaeon]